MVDIETLGKTEKAVILSVGAVFFDPYTGETGPTTHRHAKTDSQPAPHFQADASTALWWMNQSEEARKGVIDGQQQAYPLENMLYELAAFLGENSKNYYIWANSPSFDLAILRNAYNYFRLSVPWNFRNERDVRTIVSLAPSVHDHVKSVGVAHSALDDCLYQVNLVSYVYRSINIPIQL
jgi:hypothetical protein